jgi:isoleucyl-tRNA synthetase
MPYAQQHYPFENQDKFTNGFPADFIAEGLDQTRGWFYTLMVLSTALFDKPAFKNLICNGIILAEDGKKMSKRLKNYPDPEDVMSRHGADAMRLYLISSPAVRAENLRFTETGVSDMVKDIFLPFFNAYRFFVQTVKGLKVPFVSTVSNGYVQSQNLLDQWIQASMAGLLSFVRKEMAAYRLYTVVPRLLSFMDDLTNWHLRMSRNRCKGKEGQDAQIIVLSVVFEVLTVLCAALAPFVPFISDHIYQNLRLVDTARFPHASVHFLPYPQPVAAAMNEAMEVCHGACAVFLSTQSTSLVHVSICFSF